MVKIFCTQICVKNIFFESQLYVMGYIRHDKGLVLLGRRIREIRRQQKISQDQLAFESGISKNQISRIERGEINTGISTLFILAEILNVPVKDFFDF